MKMIGEKKQKQLAQQLLTAWMHAAERHPSDGLRTKLDQTDPVYLEEGEYGYEFGRLRLSEVLKVCEGLAARWGSLFFPRGGLSGRVLDYGPGLIQIAENWYDPDKGGTEYYTREKLEMIRTDVFGLPNAHVVKTLRRLDRYSPAKQIVMSWLRIDESGDVRIYVPPMVVDLPEEMQLIEPAADTQTAEGVTP